MKPTQAFSQYGKVVDAFANPFNDAIGNAMEQGLISLAVHNFLLDAAGRQSRELIEAWPDEGFDPSLTPAQVEVLMDGGDIREEVSPLVLDPSQTDDADVLRLGDEGRLEGHA